MKENKILYENLGYGDCFFEYEGCKMKKALMFKQEENNLYIGIHSFDKTNRFEIKNTDNLYILFESIFDKEKIIFVEDIFCRIKIFQKDKKIIFRFDYKYKNLYSPIEVQDENIKIRIISILEKIRSESINNVKTKKLRRQNS